jgi:hypothetical protein
MPAMKASVAANSSSKGRARPPSNASRSRSNAKGLRYDAAALLSQLAVQQSLLNQIKTCNEILQVNAGERSTQEWKSRVAFLLSGNSKTHFDDIVEDLLLDEALRSPIDFSLPTDSDSQLLVGLTFAEASGTDAAEIQAIAACLVNCAYYANFKQPPKKCYNDSFGDGTILSAIKNCSQAYESRQWKRVMDGDSLQTKADLEAALIPVEVAKLKACCDGVATVAAGAVPYSDRISKRNLIQFNQATNSPPSIRQEKVTTYGVHTFYAFKSGRECQ